MMASQERSAPRKGRIQKSKTSRCHSADSQISQLGQSRRFWVAQVTSAIPLIAKCQAPQRQFAFGRRALNHARLTSHFGKLKIERVLQKPMSATILRSVEQSHKCSKRQPRASRIGFISRKAAALLVNGIAG
jgi:hypothetical protein